MQKLKKYLAVILMSTLVIGVVLDNVVNINTKAYSPDLILNDNRDTELSITFDLNDRRVQVQTFELDDGSVFTMIAQPLFLENRNALSGTWNIRGFNPLVKMEYNIDLAPVRKGSNYTKITNIWGLSIDAKFTSVSDERLTIVRSEENSSNPAIAESYAKFKYLDNQFVSIWTQAGGIRAKVRDGKVTTSLY